VRRINQSNTSVLTEIFISQKAKMLKDIIYLHQLKLERKKKKMLKKCVNFKFSKILLYKSTKYIVILAFKKNSRYIVFI